MQNILELKASRMRHVSSINRETFRTTAEHVITRFEHVIGANEMHIEQICEEIKFCVSNSLY